MHVCYKYFSDLAAVDTCMQLSCPQLGLQEGQTAVIGFRSTTSERSIFARVRSSK